ncbi:ATP-binding protein [Caballeronia grimmiae]|uniref:ATP-binding protein n=1 Tax=Caballeronia grimmiae TaxID=1071679 RepID=UPI0038BCE945
MNLHDMTAWSERNRDWLSARLGYWRERLRALADDAPDGVCGPPPDDACDSFRPAAHRLAAAFGLSAFETELLVLAAGVEIDAALCDAVARAQGEPVGRAAGVRFALALEVLPQAHWDAISPLAPLRAWSLIDVDTSAGHARATLRIDARVLHAITGVAAFDERLAGIAHALDVAPDIACPELAEAVARALAAQPETLIVLADARLDAEHVRAGRWLAACALRRAGLRALWLDAAALAGDAREAARIARRLAREALLSQGGVVIALDGDGIAHDAFVTRFAATLNAPTVVLGAPSARVLAEFDRPVLRFAVPRMRAVARDDLPAHVLAATRRALQQFRVDPALLDQALQTAAHLGDDEKDGAERTLWHALREAARGGLDALAERIDSGTSLDDLVVPGFVATQLREIASHLRHRQTVYDEWGFGRGQSRGLGIAALFAGESGTGKTMAAEAIANAARLDLYRIDLSGVVSKYIGETEKNLAHLFDAAEASGAILLFDEADALFGKRSDVKDSHDRYANIEVAYLLQRIESYRGLAILTTNMKSALDRAFLRRLRFIVQFPFPDARSREQIWQRQIPRDAPAGRIDFAALARLQLTGGSIRSVAIHAAFRAADAGRAIDHELLVEAAHIEHAKLERAMSTTHNGSLQ